MQKQHVVKQYNNLQYKKTVKNLNIRTIKNWLNKTLKDQSNIISCNHEKSHRRIFNGMGK